MEGASERFRRAYLSDHMPLVLSFVSGESSKKRAPNLPKWAGDIKGIGTKINNYWIKGMVGTETEFDKIAMWKKAAYHITKGLMHKEKNKKIKNKKIS